MSKDAITYQNFFEQLLSSVPSFLPVYKEHIEDNDELLHHVLMGDLTRFFIQLYRAGYKEGDSDKRNAFRKVMEVLDRGLLSPDEKLQELIAVSFLENLWQSEQDFEQIRNLLTPALMNELRALESWRPSLGN